LDSGFGDSARQPDPLTVATILAEQIQDDALRCGRWHSNFVERLPWLHKPAKYPPASLRRSQGMGAVSCKALTICGALLITVSRGACERDELPATTCSPDKRPS